MDFRHKNTVRFFDYWLSLPKEKGVPLRSSFHPEKVAALLTHMMIYELLPTHRIKRRLLGSRLDQLGIGGADHGALSSVVSGVGAGICGDGCSEEEDTARFWVLGTQPCGLLVMTPQALKSGLNVMVETLCLPLLADNGGKGQIIVQKNVLDDPAFNPDRDTFEPDPLPVVQCDFIDIGAGIPELKS